MVLSGNPENYLTGEYNKGKAENTKPFTAEFPHLPQYL